MTNVKNHHISKFQHGFVNGKSTVTNLTVFCSVAFEAIMNKKYRWMLCTWTVLRNLMIDHQLLLEKVLHYGFSEKVVPSVVSECLLFTDDFKIFKTITPESDCLQL